MNDPSVASKNIAANIRAERARRHLTQMQLSADMKALGFDRWGQQTVTQIERGRREVSACEILGLASMLDVSVLTLLDA